VAHALQPVVQEVIIMGTLSKRPLSEFGHDIKDRIEDFRSNVGSRIDRLQDEVDVSSRREGAMTKGIEKLTASLPSSTWLMLAGGAVVASLAFKLAGKRHAALFIGEWVPTILMLGLYNKLVKVASRDLAAERGFAR
jgi:hypothetical protein